MNRRLKNTRLNGMQKAIFLCLVMSILTLLASCSDVSIGPIEDLSKDKAKIEKKEEVDKDKEPIIEKDYVYTSIGKRDPFKSIFDDAAFENGGNAGQETIISPLQNYDVNSFVVTAIVWGVSSPTAMVAAPDGQTYVVKTGTLIGRNWGRVIKIKHDRIVVLETKTLPSGGGKVSHMIELQLPVNKIQSQESQLDISDSTNTDEDL